MEFAAASGVNIERQPPPIFWGRFECNAALETPGCIHCTTTMGLFHASGLAAPLRGAHT